MSEEIVIERVGGFAGFGLPSSHLKSVGKVSLADLSGADRAKVDTLFARKKPHEPAGGDVFYYRITRRTPDGTLTIEVGEEDVPDALKQSIRDRLE